MTRSRDFWNIEMNSRQFCTTLSSSARYVHLISVSKLLYDGAYPRRPCFQYIWCQGLISIWGELATLIIPPQMICYLALPPRKGFTTPTIKIWSKKFLFWLYQELIGEKISEIVQRKRWHLLLLLLWCKIWCISLPAEIRWWGSVWSEASLHFS